VDGQPCSSPNLGAAQAASGHESVVGQAVASSSCAHLSKAITCRAECPDSLERQPGEPDRPKSAPAAGRSHMTG
jgi:hypothetical protein